VPQLLESVEPALPWQRDVEDDHVPGRGRHHADRRLAACRIREDGALDDRPEDLLETLPDDGA
jgi:hypothetical protein